MENGVRSTAHSSQNVLPRRRQLRVAIVVDAPNLAPSVAMRNQLRLRVDWLALMRLAATLGNVVYANVVVNFGCPPWVVRKIEQAGFACIRGVNSRDCDDRVVVNIVEAAASNVIDVIVLGGGDHAFVPAMRLASLTAKQLYVVSTHDSCATELRQAVKAVISIPSIDSQSHLCGSATAESAQ